jgi:hypothetical protein
MRSDRKVHPSQRTFILWSSCEKKHIIEILNIIVTGSIIRRLFEDCLLHLLLASTLTGKRCQFISSGFAVYNAPEVKLEFPRISRYDKCKGNVRVILEWMKRLKSLLLTM